MRIIINSQKCMWAGFLISVELDKNNVPFPLLLHLMLH